MYSLVKYTKYETCAILHRFYTWYISAIISAKQILCKHVTFKLSFLTCCQLIIESIGRVYLDLHCTFVYNHVKRTTARLMGPYQIPQGAQGTARQHKVPKGRI